jgi:hypothetical protein
MNLDDPTDFIRFATMATVETFLHSIGLIDKPRSVVTARPEEDCGK